MAGHFRNGLSVRWLSNIITAHYLTLHPCFQYCLPSKTCGEEIMPSKWKFDMNKPPGQSLISLGEVSAPIGFDVNYELVGIFFKALISN